MVMKTTPKALKDLFVALGGEPSAVDGLKTVDVLNAIAEKYEGEGDATKTPDAIDAITAVAGNIGGGGGGGSAMMLGKLIVKSSDDENTSYIVTKKSDIDNMMVLSSGQVSKGRSATFRVSCNVSFHEPIVDTLFGCTVSSLAAYDDNTSVNIVGDFTHETSHTHYYLYRITSITDTASVAVSETPK